METNASPKFVFILAAFFAKIVFGSRNVHVIKRPSDAATEKAQSSLL